MITKWRASGLNSAMGEEPWQKSLEIWSHMQKELVEPDVVTHEVGGMKKKQLEAVKPAIFHVLTS